MFATNPQLAFDIMGPEIGAANGKTTRYRGFFLVDRLQLSGFNPTSSSSFRAAVVYRNGSSNRPRNEDRGQSEWRIRSSRKKPPWSRDIGGRSPV